MAERAAGRRAAAAGIATVDAYLAARPEEARAVLERVRTAIRKALPKAEETISYRIPAYRLGGKTVLFFAGWKKHWSLYPASAAMVEAFADELAPYEVEKGTIRFPLSKPVPVGLVGRLAKFRAKEAGAAPERKPPPKR